MLRGFIPKRSLENTSDYCIVADDNVRVHMFYPSVYINAAIVSVRSCYFSWYRSIAKLTMQAAVNMWTADVWHLQFLYVPKRYATVHLVVMSITIITIVHRHHPHNLLFCCEVVTLIQIIIVPAASLSPRWVTR